MRAKDPRRLFRKTKIPTLLLCVNGPNFSTLWQHPLYPGCIIDRYSDRILNARLHPVYPT